MKTFLAGLLLLALAPIVAPEAAQRESCEDSTVYSFSYSGDRAQALLTALRKLSPQPEAVDLSPTAFIRGFYLSHYAVIYFIDENNCEILGTFAPLSAVQTTEDVAGLIPASEAKDFFGG